MTTVRITLLGKPGCHLCDDARGVVAAVVDEIARDSTAPGIEFREQSILDDPGLRERYADEIPVVLLNDRVHNYWRIDPDRLRKAILALSAERA